LSFHFHTALHEELKIYAKILNSLWDSWIPPPPKALPPSWCKGCHVKIGVRWVFNFFYDSWVWAFKKIKTKKLIDFG